MNRSRGTARRQGFMARNWPWALAAGLLILVLIFSFAANSGFGRNAGGSSAGGDAQSGGASAQSGDGAQKDGAQKQEFDLSRRIDGDPAAIGEKNAPVVLIEFADYRCPFCGKFHRDTLPKLVQEYVSDGRMRVEWRDAPVFGDQSVDAAVAARAAGAQGKFWQYQDAVFAETPESGHPDLPREVLIARAKTAGVPDMKKFEADLDSKDYAKQVQSDFEEAQRLGVASVPTFAVNDSVVSGAQPIDVFRETIEKELTEAGR